MLDPLVDCERAVAVNVRFERRKSCGNSIPLGASDVTATPADTGVARDTNNPHRTLVLSGVNHT